MDNILTLTPAESYLLTMTAREATMTPYMLPDGRIVNVDSSAAKGEPVIGFTLNGGRIVNAVIVKESRS